MKLFKTLWRGAGLGLCVVAFSGTALADPGKGNGNQPATPPGQEKKAEQQESTQGTTVAPSPAAAPGPAKKAEKQAEKQAEKTEPAAQEGEKAEKAEKAESKQKADPKPAKAERKAETKRKPNSNPAKAATPTNGQSADAHHHVIICHRTGSLSNPYVVINIPYTAWMHAHSPSTGAHPAKNGQIDILLKDPASRPGSKDGFTKAACGAPATTVTPPATSSTPSTQSTQSTGTCPATTATERVLVGVWHATGSYKNGERKYVFITPSLGSAHYTKHEDDKPVYENRTGPRPASGESCASATTSTSTTTAAANTQSSVQTFESAQTSQAAQTSQSSQTSQTKADAHAPARGVAGALSPAAEKSKPAGGVLGAIASAPKAVAATATTGTLPFTGIPLWIVALLGGALLAAGFMLRRTA